MTSGGCVWFLPSGGDGRFGGRSQPQQWRHGGSPARTSGLHGALGDIQDAGRLCDLEPVHVDQGQCHSLTLWQLLQSRSDVEPDVDAVMVVVGISQDTDRKSTLLKSSY